MLHSSPARYTPRAVHSNTLTGTQRTAALPPPKMRRDEMLRFFMSLGLSRMAAVALYAAEPTSAVPS